MYMGFLLWSELVTGSNIALASLPDFHTEFGALHTPKARQYEHVHSMNHITGARTLRQEKAPRTQAAFSCPQTCDPNR